MTKVIAEIGWNFCGDLELAKRMIQEAAKAGAAFAKFQTWSTKNLKSGPWDTDGRREIYEKAQLSEADHHVLLEECKNNNIEFLTSAFNHNDLEFISTLTNKVKIPSTEINNVDLLKKASGLFETIFLSTGASTLGEVAGACTLLKDNDLVILHCVSSYPCEYGNVNLPRIKKLEETTRRAVGYSGHGQGIFDAIASLEYLVKIVEKHFTVDNELPGRDNKFAILPQDLQFLCEYIKHKAKMNISHQADYLSCEKDMRENYRGRWQD